MKVIPDFPLEDISYSTCGLERNKLTEEETVEDLDLLIGYISESFVDNIKEKVGRLLDAGIRQEFDGEKSRLVIMIFT